jgi:hypothetical protein
VGYPTTDPNSCSRDGPPARRSWEEPHVRLTVQLSPVRDTPGGLPPNASLPCVAGGWTAADNKLAAMPGRKGLADVDGGRAAGVPTVSSSTVRTAQLGGRGQAGTGASDASTGICEIKASAAAARAVLVDELPARAKGSACVAPSRVRLRTLAMWRPLSPVRSVRTTSLRKFGRSQLVVHDNALPRCAQLTAHSPPPPLLQLAQFGRRPRPRAGAAGG